MNKIFGNKVYPLLLEYEHLIKDKETALDIGCANGSNSIFLANKGINVTAVDIDLPENICKKSSQINWVSSKIEEYNFSTKFDIIMAFNVLQFISPEDVYDVLSNSVSYLNQNGIIFISSFTDKDPSYKKSKKIKKHFKKNELYTWAADNNLHIVFYEEKTVEDNHEPYGKHIHGLVRLITIKK